MATNIGNCSLHDLYKSNIQTISSQISILEYKFQHIHEQYKLAKGFEIHKFFYLEQNMPDQNTTFNVYINAKS
jgi:hypothetical protein